MRWQLNEVNGLIWPSANGIGVMDEGLWQQTVDVAIEGAVLTAVPAAGAYRTDLAEAAHEGLEGDAIGSGFTKQVVEVTAGGE